MTINLDQQSVKDVAGIVAKEADWFYEAIMDNSISTEEREEYYNDLVSCVNFLEQVNYSDGAYGSYREMLDECYSQLFG